MQILRSRRSTSSTKPISTQELSELLHFAAQPLQVHMDTSGYFTSLRPSPSAGARHPLDIFVISPLLNDEAKGIGYYNSFEHSIDLINVDQKILGKFIELVNKNKPIGSATLLWFGACMQKTGSKYQNPESLVWRDCGALLMCLQLVGQALGLKSCPIGTLGYPHFDKMFKTKNIISGGGLLVGN